jgi:hypothetical protein
MTAFAVIGAASCFRRAPRVTAFVTTALIVQAVAVALSGAIWINRPLILSRYLLLFLPFLLLSAALGSQLLAERIAPWTVYPVALAVLASAWLLGPVPDLLGRPNAFPTHQVYFMDFDRERNEMRPVLEDGPMPAFYRELGRGQPGELTLLETPWRFESIFNRQPLFQEVHRQHVKLAFLGGVCPPGLSSEQPRKFPNRFRNFVDLAWPDERVIESADYLVVHRELELMVPTLPWMTYDGRGLPAVDNCLADFERRFGKPVFEDETISVYQLGPPATETLRSQ